MKQACVGCVDLKNSHNLQVEFYLAGIFRTSNPGDSISSDPERTALKGQKRGARLYRSFATEDR